jgi:hypothetical protein
MATHQDARLQLIRVGMVSTFCASLVSQIAAEIVPAASALATSAPRRAAGSPEPTIMLY